VTVPKAVRAWVADVESTHEESFDSWFPPEFDWRALCADLPAIVDRLGGAWAKGTAAAAKARLEEHGGSAFRGAYVAALALLAGYDVEADPHAALERLVAPLEDDDERERFVEGLGALDDLERALQTGGGRAAGTEHGTALEAASAVLEPVRALLVDGLVPAARSVAVLGGPAEAVRTALSGVVVVAVAVAALRHRAAGESDARRGDAPLRLDHRALASALCG
jgi:hypothetical protein